MPRQTVFDLHSGEYDAWYDEHGELYRAELKAVEKVLPGDGIGLEVGVGSGRFAGPLNIAFGIDPSLDMAAMASQRGVSTALAVAEALPFMPASFHYVVFITSLCFVQSVSASLAEASRVLKSGGHVVIGLVNRDSDIGKNYEAGKEQNMFYRNARFLSADDIAKELDRAGFVKAQWCQTLCTSASGNLLYDVLPGHEKGGFVVVRAQLP